jgi:biopolymer transport protein ExbD
VSGRSFRRRSALATWDMHFGPNMTPMVDVVMVILIFFMASATFAGAEWFLKAGIPREGGAESGRQPEGSDPLALPPARFEITLSVEGGRTMARGQGVGDGDLSDLPARLTQLAAGLPPEEIVLIIRPDAAVPYPDVIRAHDAAAQAGIKKVGMMDVKPEP